MKADIFSPALEQTSANNPSESKINDPISRRSFLRNGAVAGAGVVGTGLLVASKQVVAEESHGHITRGDAAILRFLAAAEILETDMWQQYNELAGVVDSEVPGGTVIPDFANAVSQLDSDMSQYIHDNTEDEMTHEQFINAYLISKGAKPVDLSKFATLPSSKVTGAQQIGRLTNLMQLTLDTSWWTRYRSRTGNPDLGDTFAPAIPSLATGQHPGIPRSDSDLSDPNFLQAIAYTAGFHFPGIEVGGTSLYPSLAQRVTSSEVLRIVLSIGGTEVCHFQTWQDKAGNVLPLSAKDPMTGVEVEFPDLNSPPFGGQDFQTNLIMPEPTAFLSRSLPACSIIRPTMTKGAAMGALKGLTGMGIFIGQSPAFFAFMTELAEQADAATRGGV